MVLYGNQKTITSKKSSNHNTVDLYICKSYASVEILSNNYLYKVGLKIMTLPALILHNTNSKHSIIPLIQGLYEELLGVLLSKGQRHNSNIHHHIYTFTNE